MLLQHLDATDGKISHVKRVVIGGSAVPEAIVRAFHDRFGYLTACPTNVGTGMRASTQS